MTSSFKQHSRRKPLMIAALAVVGLDLPMRADADVSKPALSEQYACATAAGAQQRSGREERDEKRDGDKRDNEGRRSWGGPMSPWDFGWSYGRSQGDLRPPQPHEWAEVQFFMNRHSPRRQAALDELPDDDKKESLKRFVFARFRSLRQLQRRDRAAYEQRLSQLAVEDQIYGMVSDWAATPDADRERLKDALQSEVSRLVDIDLQQRRRRVEWLKQQLSEETAKVEQDEKDRDAQIERRVSRYADWAEKWAARRAKKDKDKEKAPEAPADERKRD